VTPTSHDPELKVFRFGVICEFKAQPFEEVADLMGRYRDEVGVEHFVLFFDMPGLTQEAMDTQLEMMATEVLPRLGVTLGS